MSNNKGRSPENAVPRKLAKGMDVVVWLKPCIQLYWQDAENGIVNCKWLKGKLYGISSDGWYVVEINEIKIAFQTHEAIIIRSTSYADNEQKYANIKNKQRYAARKATKEFKSF